MTPADIPVHSHGATAWYAIGLALIAVFAVWSLVLNAGDKRPTNRRW